MTTMVKAIYACLLASVRQKSKEPQSLAPIRTRGIRQTADKISAVIIAFFPSVKGTETGGGLSFVGIWRLVVSRHQTSTEVK